MEIPKLYVPATRLPLKSHRPPQPFGKTDYKHVQTPGVPYISPEIIRHLNSDDLIYAVHPRERYKPPNGTDDPSIAPLPDWYTDNQEAKIKIVCPLSTGMQGAQAVLCEVIQAPDVLWKRMGHKRNDLPRKVVAKIYDPLHYRGHIDPVAEADREYAQEAAAYIQLHGKRDTKVYTDKPDLVPKFYGTWTTDITFNHFRKTGMFAKDRAKTLKAEASKRKRFDAAVAAAAKNGDSSSKQSKLSPHSFRPVRVILTQYIDGTPLWQHLIKAIDDTQSPIIKPREKFKQEEVRLNIFGSMLDTIARIEHLGVKLLTVPTRAPAVFLITEKREVANVHEEANAKYGVVMTDFTQADVSYYTDIGYDLVEKLPLPDHPMTSYEIDRYISLRGWFPPEWMDDVEQFYKWADSHFKSSDYADPETVDRVVKEVGWVEDLRKHGRIPPHQDDPEWQEKLKALWAYAPESWRNLKLPTAEEDRQRRERTKEVFRVAREKEEEEEFKQSKQLFHDALRQRARREYNDKFGQRPSGLDDPEWRQTVDEVYANVSAQDVADFGKIYDVSPKKKKFTFPTAEEDRKRREASKETIRIAREKRKEEQRKFSLSVYHEGKRDMTLEEYQKKFGHRPSGPDDSEWQLLVDKAYANAPESCIAGKSYEITTSEETLRIAREKRDAENLKKRKLTHHRINKIIALGEYKKKFGQRPSSSEDPEWRQLVDKLYANVPEDYTEGMSYEISANKASEKEQAKQPEEVEHLRLSVQATTMTDTLPAEPKDESSPATPQQSTTTDLG